MSISPNGEFFATMGKDRQVRIFRFLTGKLHRTYDESLAIFNKNQKVRNFKNITYQKINFTFPN